MKARSCASWVLLAIVAGTLAGEAGCSRSCSVIGCGPQVSAVLRLTAEPPPETKVRACHNDACFDGTVTGGAGDEPVSVRFPDPQVTASIRLDVNPEELQVWWTMASGEGADGDRFTVDVTDPTGASLGHVSGTATFHTTTPNGPDCPGVCREGAFSAS